MRNWISAHAVASAVIALVIGLAAGAGLSAVASQSEVDDLEAQVADLKDEVADAEGDADEAEDELASREDSLARREADLRQREREQSRDLAEQQAEVEAREREVSQAEAAQEQNKIAEGIWQLGRDYEAGLYRAPGGGSCYWAELGSGNTDDIINNGGFSKNQTIEIDSPFFETSGCGDWVKIG